MPLQIRRGNTTQRLSITPLVGELIYDTTTREIFVGDGVTAGGAVTTGVSLEDARDVAASLFTTGVHTGIVFSYDDENNRIDATVPSGLTLEEIQDISAELLTNGIHSGGITFNYDDTNNRIDVSIPEIPTLESAQDVAADLFTNGIHSGISFVYDDTANTVNATLIGPFNGDLKGSVFADDSTLLIDGTSGTLVGPLATSGLASNLNLNGFNIFSNAGSNITLSVSAGGLINVTGGIQVNNFIRSSSSTLSLQSTGPVTIAGTSASPDGNLIISRNSYTSSLSAGFIFEQYHSTSDAVNFTFFRGRGTSSSLLPVQNGDDIADIVFAAVSSTGPVASALITVIVDGIPSGANVPAKIQFETNNGIAFAPRAELSPAGVWKIDQLSSLNNSNITVLSTLSGDVKGSIFADDSTVIIDATEGGKISTPSVSISEFLQLPVFADDTARLAAISTPVKGMVIMIETGTTPAATNQLQFFDGTNWVNI